MKQKAYWTASVHVEDAEKYKQYLDYVLEPFGKYGGRYLVRAGRSKVVEGQGGTVSFRTTTPRSPATNPWNTGRRLPFGKTRRSTI